MFLGLVGPMEWPEEHWEGQNYHPRMTDYQNALPAASDTSESLFGQVAGLSPEEFIERLQKAQIVRRVYNERAGTIERKNTGKVIIELERNFYSLPNTDKMRIAELLGRSYQQDTYVLKDAITGKIVGQITPEGLNLY